MGLSRFYLLSTLCSVLVLSAQHPAAAQLRWPESWQLEIGASTHVAGYCGDIGHKGRYGLLSDTQWHLVQMGGGLGMRAQQKGKRIAWNLDLQRIRIQGADSVSNNIVAFVRNLHFRNEMTELATTVDYPLLRMGGGAGSWTLAHSLRMQGGLALLHHAPMARVDRDNPCYDKLIEMGYTTPGEWHDLRTVQTEGSTYDKWILTVPFGLSWTLTADNGSGRPWHVTLSGLFRWTWTDHLDDINARYANPWDMNPLGLALTSQSNAADQPPCPGAPSISTFQYQQGLEEERQPQRGNVDTRDSYWTVGLKVSRSMFSTPVESFHRKRFRGPRVENKR